MEKPNRNRSKLDKDRTLPQGETLDEFLKLSTSPNSIPRAIQNTILRSTLDPMNSHNAAPRSIYDLRRIDHDALGIDTRSRAKSGKLWCHLLHPGESITR